ncbi:hypothetical protein JAAARDRAFT_503020 [Jaapia argillacea MUCL 33604]|uniref:Uncharacterized protein n=1 Tax=Jaapia argillacea MUCL 33604 TaxID=933084 RepID=A0A067P9W6_9AGAM|nr:hypothetical protein JAAARDRAFT_503020 [Jaapia argillacea MUCL 33604]
MASAAFLIYSGVMPLIKICQCTASLGNVECGLVDMIHPPDCALLTSRTPFSEYIWIVLLLRSHVEEVLPVSITFSFFERFRRIRGNDRYLACLTWDNFL